MVTLMEERPAQVWTCFLVTWMAHEATTEFLKCTSPPHGSDLSQLCTVLASTPMSGLGSERTFSHTLNYVCFAPESGRQEGGRCMSANDPKRG